MALLTIREAADLTGHSTHKIRRLIKSIAEQPGHADRSLIEPSAADVERLAADEVQFTWRISEELVRRELGESAATAVPKQGAAMGESAITDAVVVLERALSAQEAVTERLLEQLKVKDAQIEGMQQFMHSLNERLRESNILMGSLQKQLPGPSWKGTEEGPAVRAAAPSAKSKSKAAAGPKQGRRRSWLRAMFG
ncbi:MAG TPA: hypothetical protein VMV69_10295 [Pirellulales bacterium]|nr:hypothetical protein [Pirellulales bacterium]